jgi:hypothetical protein
LIVDALPKYGVLFQNLIKSAISLGRKEQP